MLGKTCRKGVFILSQHIFYLPVSGFCKEFQQTRCVVFVRTDNNKGCFVQCNHNELTSGRPLSLNSFCARAHFFPPSLYSALFYVAKTIMMLMVVILLIKVPKHRHKCLVKINKSSAVIFGGRKGQQT